MREGEEKRSSEWSGEERFAAVMETHAMSEEEVGPWCSRRGVNGHELEQWRREAYAPNTVWRSDISYLPTRGALRTRPTSLPETLESPYAQQNTARVGPAAPTELPTANVMRFERTTLREPSLGATTTLTPTGNEQPKK